MLIHAVLTAIPPEPWRALAATLLFVSAPLISSLCLANPQHGDSSDISHASTAVAAQQSRQQPRKESIQETAPETKRQRLREGFADLSPRQKAKLKAAFVRWNALNDRQKQQFRQNLKRFQSLPPEERKALRASHRRFKDLPAHQRQKLQQRWRNMNLEQRRRALHKIRKIKQQRQRQSLPRNQ